MGYICKLKTHEDFNPFTDMIRPNRFSFVNDNINRISPFEKSIEKLGGTFTQIVLLRDLTHQGLALLWHTPKKNGCDTRVKWPRYFRQKS